MCALLILSGKLKKVMKSVLAAKLKSKRGGKAEVKMMKKPEAKRGGTAAPQSGEAKEDLASADLNFVCVWVCVLHGLLWLMMLLLMLLLL